MGSGYMVIATAKADGCTIEQQWLLSESSRQDKNGAELPQTPRLITPGMKFDRQDLQP